MGAIWEPQKRATPKDAESLKKIGGGGGNRTRPGTEQKTEEVQALAAQALDFAQKPEGRACSVEIREAQQRGLRLGAIWERERRGPPWSATLARDP